MRGDEEMSLRDDIEREVSSRRETKADKLLKVKDDIEYMLKSKLTLQKQIELLLKNKIIDKLDMKEYRNILIKHFNYQPKHRTKHKTQNKTPLPTSSNNNMKSAKDILSQEITL